jgi:hypothetical protein
MRSNNHSCSVLHSNFTLVADTDDQIGGAFNVSARTSNSPLNIGFNAAPVDSRLHLDARTSNSPARVSLHPTFEGAFELATGRWFTHHVEEREDVEDPAGKGRKRYVVLTLVRPGMGRGTVSWGSPNDHGPGKVTLRTSNSPVALVV